MYDKLEKVFGILVCVCIAGWFLTLVSGFAMAYLIMLIITVVTIVLGACLDPIRRMENERNPITTVTATVVGHRKESYQTRYGTSARYYVSFKPEDGSPALEFQVNESDYEAFELGETACLRYRTWEFLSFGAKDLSKVEPLSKLPDEYEPSPDEIVVEVDWAAKDRLIRSLLEKARTLHERIRKWSDARKQAKEPQDAEDGKVDGILTHELDEPK